MAKRFYRSGEDAVQLKKVYGKGMAADKKYADETSANRDSRMIREDWSKPCLLPTEIIDKDWARNANYMKNGEADLFMGVQKQLKEDGEGFKKAFKPGKY